MLVFVYYNCLGLNLVNDVNAAVENDVCACIMSMRS